MMNSSKRKSSNSHNREKKKRKSDTSNNEEKCIFSKLTEEAGLILKSGVAQVYFQRDLAKLLQENEKGQTVIGEFVESFQQHIEDVQRLKSCLMPTLLAADSDLGTSGGRQECLIRLLLGVDSIQPNMMSVLLEKLMDVSDNEEAEIGLHVNIPQLILNQFRWLDHIVDPKACVDKMFDMISITPLEVQKEIISCIPELVDDDSHADVARKLKDILTTDVELSVTILDAFTNLNLKSDLLTEVRNSVIGNMASMEFEDLPAVVKFLLQSVSSNDAVEVIKEMRSKLDLTTSSLPASTQQRAQSEAVKKSKQGCEALTMDAIKMEVLFRKNVADAWIKVVQNVKSAAEHCPVDIFVLLILYNNAQSKRRNAVESLFRNKIRAGHFTENLLQTAFESYRKILRESFNSILTLAEVLLRSPQPTVCYFAMAMYKQAVINFDTACQQEVISNLVTHIGSGVEGEIDSALDVLAYLAENHFKKLCPFAIFIKGVLDHLDNLTMGQIRKLYSTLSILGFSNQDGGALIQDDMHILVRKQLSNSSLKYKRMGIIGAIMMVKSLGKSRNGKFPDDVFRQVVNLLNLVNSSCAKMPEASCLFVDELSNLIQRSLVHQRIENWVNENVIRDFEDDYIGDFAAPDVDPGTNVVPMELSYGLDDDSEGGIVVNIVPITVNSMDKKAKRAKDARIISPLCIAPQYRLLKVCITRAHQGDLEEISATLGCPLMLPAENLYDKLDSLSMKEKELICTTLFHAHNWFIEVINGFAEDSHVEFKAKVITRLQNITELRKNLQKALAATPNFVPPPACFEISDDGKPIASTSTTSAGKKATGKGKGRKKKGDNKDKENSDDTAANTQLEQTLNTQTQGADKSIQITQKQAANNNNVDLSLYRKYFRELDMCVFKILRSGTISKATLDSEENPKNSTTLQVQPPELEYLLEDLNRKLEHSLIASACKRRCFLKTKSDKNVGFSQLDLHSSKSVAKLAVKLLPTLCDHLDGSIAYFNTLMTDNDGVVDGPGWQSEESKQVGNCLCLLLQAITTILSWNGFLMNEHSELMKDVFISFSSRITPESDDVSQLPLQSLMKQSYKYFDKLSSNLPTLKCAVKMCKLLNIIADKSDLDPLHQRVGHLANKYLKREWLGADGEREKGMQCNENLQTLLKLFLTHTGDKLAALENLATVALPEILEGDRNVYSTTYPTLSRNTYHVYYRCMLAELVTCVKAMEPVKTSDAIQKKMDFVVKWNLAVRIFQVLVNLIKAFDARSNLNSLLKSGRVFIELFMRQGMPILDSVFRAHREDVQSLLKNLQSSTRALHHICGHSKIVKDVTLTNQVPLMKKCLESFVYRVKQMLTVNKCLDAFWLGNLKNRDLKGEEILSQQQSTQGTQDETNDDIPDALLDEDSESDVEVDGEEETGKAGSGSDESYSEIY